MECKKCVLLIDAVPHNLSVNVNTDNIYKNKSVLLHKIFEDFTEEEYKSAFFLLMDYVNVDTFLDLTKQEKRFLERAFLELYNSKFEDDKILIELLGTMKMYKKLRLLDTCTHVYKNQVNEFNQIDGIWKMLYSICEELSDDDLNSLIQMVPNNIKDQIVSSEDWFCWALQFSVISETDLTKLESIFQKHPQCSSIIKNYTENKPHDNTLETYNIRYPTGSSYCGIALIFDFETFDEKSKLKKRIGSNVDVDHLKSLWQHFGFKTKVFKNKTKQETLQILYDYSTLDHSNYDAFICCILSHGNSNSVYSSDGQLITISRLIAAVTNNKSCLSTKPKLFFIQACQGINIQQGVGEPVYSFKTANNPIPEEVPPIKLHVLNAVSSIDGYVSFRDVENGSWFINALCKLMMKYGDKLSILDVMTEVNRKVHTKSANFGPKGPQKAKQIVNFSSTLQKKLILKRYTESLKEKNNN